MPSPSASRVVRPVVEPGDVLAGRYRLVEPLSEPDDPYAPVTWQAVDDVLARPVALTVLPAGGRRGAAAAGPFLEAAAAAGVVGRGSGVLAQVFDAAIEQRPAERYGRPAGSTDVAYVVSEWVQGRPLSQVLADDGPFEPHEAVRLTVALAEALAAAHDRGAWHGRIHPGNVLLTDGGGVRLTGTAVAAAFAAGRQPAGPDPAEPAARPDLAAQDVRDLAACLYAMLTARWPRTATSQPGRGLRDAPTSSGRDGRLCSPAQVRAGVPRPLDAVIVRALEPSGAGRPDLDTADDLAAALDRAVRAEPAAHQSRARTARRRPSRRTRRVLPWLLTAGLLLAVGLGSYSAGERFGAVDSDRSELEALVDSPPAPVPGDPAGEPGERLDLTGSGVRVLAFDPPPGDGTENDGALRNAVDGDPSTGWDTERYDTELLGGLKNGVGLLLDLGEPVEVAQVEAGVRPGGDLQLRAADAEGATIEDYRVVAAATGTDAVVRLVPDAPVTARYWVVWLTRLPADGSRFQGRVGELFFVRP